MRGKQRATEDPDQPTLYEIRIEGHLDEAWEAWFGGMSITSEANGDTRLTGPLIDQAALYGLLRRVRDLGMPLISVIRFEPSQVERTDIKQDNFKQERC